MSYPQFTELFGKRYMWDLDADGKLRLHQVFEGKTIKNLTYEALMETLDEVREGQR